MEILLVPAGLILFSCMIFQSAQKKASPWKTLCWIVLLILLSAVITFFAAAVRSNYGGQKEWRMEKQYFLGIFTRKLESSGDLKTAALYMRSIEVKEQTLRCIQKIVHSFHFKTLLFLTGGSVILLLGTASLWIPQIAGKKLYPYLLLFCILSGTVIADAGFYFQQYARGTDKMLKNILRCQQEFLMKELSEVKTSLTIPQIIKITHDEAERLGFGYGQNLPQLIGKEAKSPAAKKKKRL